MQSAAMNVRQVAELLAVDEKTIYRLVQRGELPGFKVAGAWRFAREDLDAWIEAQKNAVAKPKKKAAAKAKQRGKR
jgi:excisionase family DNA binding protein